eukprot:CAMPEP_0184025120 /NCGR_PEP_ID=MMETSP0954-20121128/12573_1 /TAXON_ID=627963 /ORGANISM="Aplanochytrium sp, Strain PBS07" /LENGTH=78 /DNA_ID=CAMNT_0026308747 /DNA_START=442 /DNA_END=674 /DNA_ORIENTATION=-
MADAEVSIDSNAEQNLRTTLDGNLPSERDDKVWKFHDELPHFYRLAWPVVLTSLLELFPGIISVIFVGQYCDKDELDA